VISVGLVRSRQAGDQSGIPAEEYAVYAAVIGNMFADDKVSFDTQSKVKMLVIEDRTVSEATDGGGNDAERLKAGFSTIISQETIDDYVTKNAKSHQLTKSLDLKLKYTLNAAYLRRIMRVWTLSVACEDGQGMGGPKKVHGVDFIDRSGFWIDGG
jgi:hypothetical protein